MAVLFTRLCFSLVAMLVDAATILAAMLASDFAYNEIVHDAGSVCVANIQIGLFAAILFVGSNLLRNSYSLADYLDLSGHARQVFSQWNLAFLAAATFGFLARVIEDTSRGTFLVFYVAGLCALFLGRAGLVHLMKRNAVAGSALAARVVIVGFAKDIDDFISMQQPEQQGMLVVARHTIAEDRAIRDTDLAEATTMIRRLMPDDIVIAVPWNRTDTIEACVTAFLRVPASIHLHLDPDSPLNRFGGANMGANGAISGFRLRGYAIGTLGSVLKRGSDIILSALALIMLAPVFLAIAVAIRLDSPGPVLFRQMRHGFNKEPFRILKFRSMKVAEDGPVVTQATADDPRITRVGRWLRRYNLDELPQLLNVLMGQMSLVGPRPHALVHDDAFEQNIVLYARRHNVKPGITGWAQVNGLRGETDTPEKISQRVHHDLYYIDHWSFVLDVWILFLTLFSRKAYRNAG
ncbi:MAG TPA: exopolysaccharide biosynthesis polyprenyl glycosylphosphotransferase [Beijerinckiaceae bacterium]|nr:exopolysaccharide biosynthesis polyprenyl glycosylphosphotransferase [Beijerinckiaceae bacterium]